MYRTIAFLSILVLLLGCVLAPASASADALTLVVPTDYATIQAAVDAAAALLLANPGNSYSVLVEPGTYPGGITLKSNIPLRGRETARTILSGGGGGAIMTAAGVTGVSVRNFSFRNAAVGINVTGLSSLTIENNIFSLGLQGTGVQMAASASGRAVNNTFLQNKIALSRGSDVIQVTNNIFSNNTTNIAGLQSNTNISYNAFNPDNSTELRGTSYIPNPAHQNPDPLFVNADAPDLHLLSGPTGSSPCVDTGDPTIYDPYILPGQTTNISDMGAYGGPNADTVPLRVAGLLVTKTETAPYTLTLTWNADNNYLVGGYNVYYGHAPGDYTGTDAVVSGGTVTSPSPINAGMQTSISLIVDPVSPAPAAPVLDPPSPRNESLVLTWSSVPGATSYRVHYLLVSDPSVSGIRDVGNMTAHTLTGLTNGQLYSVAVSAVSQAMYYLTATTYDVSGQTGTPGTAHESAYAGEQPVAIGPMSESGLSNEVTGMPETIVPYPNLPNSGCFIATSAYGSASAPAVQMLRRFRDRLLLTNAPGRAFVSWYYAHSPAAASALDRHPELKPLTRAALAPIVAAAYLATEAPVPTIALAALGMFVLLSRRRAAVPIGNALGKSRRSSRRTIITIIAALLLFPAAAVAAGPPMEPPHWSVEVKGGWFYPAADNWETYYGRDNTWHYAGSLAYKVTRSLDVGVEGGFIKDEGRGYAPGNNIVAGRVVYELFPLNVFILVRGVFSERQIIVPYLGGGWTRMFYREAIDGQGTVRGSADGYHGRAGLQFLLDDADAMAARNLYRDFGIKHTYFFTEAQLTKVTAGTPEVDIGGTSYLMGLLFEF